MVLHRHRLRNPRRQLPRVDVAVLSPALAQLQFLHVGRQVVVLYPLPRLEQLFSFASPLPSLFFQLCIDPPKL